MNGTSYRRPPCRAGFDVSKWLACRYRTRPHWPCRAHGVSSEQPAQSFPERPASIGLRFVNARRETCRLAASRREIEHGEIRLGVVHDLWAAKSRWPVLTPERYLALDCQRCAAELPFAAVRWPALVGHNRALSTGSFYGDSFVKAFLVVRAAMSVRMPVSRGRSIWQIRGWGMRKVRASARTSFYPWRTQASDTTCNIRAECAGKPLLAARPIFGDGHVAVTRCLFGRVDLRSCC